MKLNNVEIVLDDKTIKNSSVHINGGKIFEILKNGSYKDGIDCKGNILLPGFIDMHMHGGYGIDFYNLDDNNIKELISNLNSEGVTSFCLGNVATKVGELNKKLKELEKIVEGENNINNSLLGFYIEGPFISLAKKGAHNPDYLEKPNLKNAEILLKDLNPKNIKYVVYAPEESDDKFADYVINKGIVLSIGHTNADYYKAKEELLKSRSNHLTHFNNAMTLYNHRDPGVVNFGFLHDKVLCELISDGVHNDMSVIELVYKIKTANNMAIITDSMNAKGLKNGRYKLGSLDVDKKDNVVSLLDGSLAGSSATYIHCVKQFIKATKCDFNELNKVTSYNVAKEMKLEKELGLIKEGYKANLVLLNKENYDVEMTISNGEIVYEKRG